MAGEAVIGALRVVLGADNDNFDSAMDASVSKIGELESAFETLGEKMKAVGAKVAEVGAAIVAGLSASMAVVSATSLHAAADFETAMKRVGMALDGVSADALKAMGDQARQMGAEMGRSATDSAQAIEELAKTGLSAGDIMGGAFAASLKLAAIGQTDLGTSAQLTASLIRDFSVDARDMGPTIDKVTGALMAGHGGMAAYAAALSAAGEQAGQSGVSFRDFNATIAGIGQVMHKSEDAGSSLKSFLSKLGDESAKAKQEMKDLGVSFYDASGRVKPMADVADQLQKHFAGLNDQVRTKVFTEMFDTAGLSTAVTLMRLGKKGFEDLQSTIDKASGDTQAAKAQEGYAAAVARLSAAWENLKITIGEAGLVDLLDLSVTNALTKVIQIGQSLSPIFYRIGAACSALSTAMGPLLLVVGGAMYLAFGFFLRSLGPIGWAISALIEPVGTLVAGLRVLAMQFGSTLGMAAIRASFAALISPIGLVTVAVAALGYAWYSHEERLAAMNAEQERLRTTLGGAKPALDAAAEAIDGLAGKTGVAAQAARDHAAALLAEARAAAMAAASTAQNDAAMAKYQSNKANRDITIATGIGLGSGGLMTPVTDIYSKARQSTADAYKKTADEAADAAKAAQTRYDQLVAGFNAPAPKAINYTPPSDKKPKKDGEEKDKHGLTADDLRMQKEIEAAQLRGDLAEAQAMQDRLDLSKQIEAYQRTGLGLVDATARANRDMKDIEASRLQSQSRAIADQQRSIAITIAERDQNYSLEDSLQRQADLERLILFYKGQSKTEAQAEALARKDQADQDASQARVRERWFQDDADARALRLAQLRGDSDAEIAQLQRVIDVKKRADELEKNSNGTISHDDAVAQANREMDQNKQAEATNKFRDIFRGGFKAAMDGDVSGWFTTWWKDRVQKGMEQALNALSDLVARLFSSLSTGQNGSSSGGGLFGSLGSIVGSLFGKGGTGAAGVDMTGWTNPIPAGGPMSIAGIAIPDLPAFATGGSFKVGGRSGIDQNLVSFRATQGEMVDIHKAGSDGGPVGSTTIHMPIQYSGAVDIADKSYVAQMASATHRAVMDGLAQGNRRASGR